MDILAYDDFLRVEFSATNKKTFPKNEYNVVLVSDEVRILESGTDIVQLKVKDVTTINSITDNRTGGAGLISGTAYDTITKLRDVLEPFFFNSLTATLGAISINVDDLERGVWEKIPGNSLEIEYYVGVFAPSGNFGNPSGTTTNVKTLTYKTSGVTQFYQDFAYNSVDGAIKVTAR